MIEKWESFNEQVVLLDNGRGGNQFQTNKYGAKSIASLNNKIKNYIESVYGPYGFKYGMDNIDLNVDGNIINTEYISKMVNNYTVFKSVIRNYNLKTEDEFYNYMENNLKDVYHFNSRFFHNETLPILINTTRRGNIGEQKSIEFFNNFLKEKGFNSTVEKPTITEDLSGVDGKFVINGRTCTMQIKPFSKYDKTDFDIIFYSDGSLSLGTDYLLLYDNKWVFVFRSKDIKIDKNTFVSKLSNIVATNISYIYL